SGKTIAPFCTHEGSGLADTVASIRRVVVGATVLDGMELRGAVAQNDVDATVRAVDGWLG
ncbi:flavodoxin family protein, partial [Bifidobacterium longum]